MLRRLAFRLIDSSRALANAIEDRLLADIDPADVDFVAPSPVRHRAAAVALARGFDRAFNAARSRTDPRVAFALLAAPVESGSLGTVHLITNTDDDAIAAMIAGRPTDRE